ncbi:Asp23/Gls24 family envelope stress response protein [Cellulomonas sp. NS3]|uniref:Asp23/Gls24 family envelope stress response protein n=1 Tax=Cellulomonas sp. NS3 TaxID=2973977 RepID=UPI00216170F8|nr:Asp23/Gls24 family envelope stress response protein [Cellulomonas sp. NS3]
MSTTDDPRLPCGARYDDLLTRVADRTPPPDHRHQATCPHCRAALADLEAAWEPLHELAAEDVRAPDSVLAAVMTHVRELARHTWYADIPTEQGHTRIGARVIGAVARLAAEELPGVALALGHGHVGAHSDRATTAGPASESATVVGVAGSHVVVDIHVAVELGTPIPTTAARLRAHVARSIAAHLGLTTVEVNITVADIHHTGATRRRQA